jgi:uncharacterized RDD family membrane protein YckC
MASPSRVDSVSYVDLQDELLTGEAVALDLRPASFVLRAAGTIIDFLVYMVAYILLLLLLIDLSFRLQLDSAISTAIAVATLVVCIVIAPATVETLSHGKSLGKLAVGARIVRDDGGAIGVRHASIRALMGVLEIFMTLGGIAAIVGLLSGRAKRLGDVLAGTYSQNERVGTTQPLIFGVPVELQAWAATADVAKMPDALARRVSHFLSQAGGLTPETRVRLSADLANEVAVYVSPVPRSNAELFLAAVVAVRRDREYAALELERRGLDRLSPVLTGLPHRFPDR